ncbi:hypothetical protein ABT186_05310 [Streptomyces sp. NPDC001634]|uniref:DUF6907 domain-containing protein n=1 Tax=Streptomyces sp. NPDC001634 TaxID=3154390 RepID=UPI0033349F8D
MTNKTIAPQTTEQAPAVEPRTITYPLKTGGSLTSTCPPWCTYDHTDDVARGIDPDNLFHQGDKIAAEYSVDGVEMSILEARIAQWPFDPDDGTPHIELVPEGRTAVGVYCRNRIELDDEIRRVRAHLGALIELGGQLGEAQAADHARNHRGDLTPWLSLSRIDLQSLPIAYLLRAFGVTVVETEDIGCKAVSALYGDPGAMELRIKPDMSQYMREDRARHHLLDWYEAQIGGDRV